jgi:hypothetical protein
MRRRSPSRNAVAITAGGIGAVLVACAVVPLDVGGDGLNAPEVGPASPASDASDDGRTIERLQALCAGPTGVADGYENAAMLTERLVRRWYHCPALGTWALPPGTALELTRSGDHAFLRLNAREDGFEPSTDPEDKGPFRYLTFLSPDGAVDVEAGLPSKFLPMDDTERQSSIFLYLVRPNLADLRFLVDFEQNPRRMTLRQIGESGALGYFVPID